MKMQKKKDGWNKYYRNNIMNVNELPCPCNYWKCGYWNRETDECNINHRSCEINRSEQTENE